MKNGNWPKLIVLGLLVLATDGPPAANAEGIEVDGSIRTRAYVLLNHDFDGQTTDRNNFATLRTRVGFSAAVGEYASAYVQIQDSRVLGEPKDTETSLEQVDLHQGFIHIHNAFNVPLDFKLGRTEMAYGQHRQIGDQEWFEVGRSFDGAVMMYDIEDVGWFHLFGMKTKETGGIPLGVNHGDGITRIPGAQNPESAFVGGYFRFDMTEEAALEAYLFDNYQDNGEAGIDFDAEPGLNSGTAHMFTTGGRLRWRREGDRSNVLLYGEGAYQFGTTPNTVADTTGGVPELDDGVDIAAYAVVAGAKVGTSSGVDGWLKLEFNLASGDAEPDANEVKTYRQLFPSTHPVLGAMDFVGWQNIQALTFEAGINPDDAWKLWASFHLFSLNQAADTWYGDDGQPFHFYMVGSDGRRQLVSLEGRGSPDYDSSLGNELDVSIGFRPEENLYFEGQFGAWFPGKWQEQALHDLRADLDAPAAEDLGVAYTVYLSAEVSW